MASPDYLLLVCAQEHLLQQDIWPGIGPGTSPHIPARIYLHAYTSNENDYITIGVRYIYKNVPYNRNLYICVYYNTSCIIVIIRVTRTSLPSGSGLGTACCSCGKRALITSFRATGNKYVGWLPSKLPAPIFPPYWKRKARSRS